VVSPGDGDYFKMVVNKTVKLRGRVVDVAKKPLKGVDLRAAILPAFHWREADTAAVSNDLGEFELVVPEGSVLIQAKHENLHKEVHTPAPLPEGEVLEIVMESLAIRGCVARPSETRERRRKTVGGLSPIHCLEIR
jgi:hypothetical protein